MRDNRSEKKKSDIISVKNVQNLVTSFVQIDGWERQIEQAKNL